MTNKIHEILIRGDAQGNFIGAHVKRFILKGYDLDSNPIFEEGLPENIVLEDVDDLINSNFINIANQLQNLIAENNLLKEKLNLTDISLSENNE